MKKVFTILLMLILVSTLAGCKPGEVGPPGPKGVQGIQGVQGPAGEQGPQGEVGTGGASGLSGSQGEPGPQGEIGPAGEEGPRGPGGARGSTGATGAKGATGAAGATGAQGDEGSAGAKGDKGDTGAKGDKGDPGEPSTTGDVLLLSVIDRGAFRLLVTQNGDGGWDWGYGWTPSTDPAPGTSAYNTIGVTAQGMLDTYKETDSSRYLDACIDAYELMVVNSENLLDAKVHRIRGPDIPFLVELSEVTNKPEYAEFAERRYEAALEEYADDGTATGFAEFVRDLRVDQKLPALVAWDINLYVQGALALGETSDAALMADVIHEFLYVNGFNLEDNTQVYYYDTIAGALEAFATTKLYPDKVTELTTNLLDSQQANGSFLVDSVNGEYPQTTAYAVMALAEVLGYDRAMASAVNYLIGCQETNGSWLVPGEGEYTEVSSEIIQAIYDYIK